VARKTVSFRWVFLIQVAIGMGGPVVGRLVWSSSHSMWSGYGAVFAVPVAAVAVAIAAVRVRRLRRRGETVRGILLRRRERARALVDSADKLRALAPVGAGLVTLASFPAVFLALAAAPMAGGVSLPPAADARLQLWCIAAAVLIAAVGLDCWYGPGISARALSADGFIAAELGFTVALAATSPLMIFHHVESRGAWLWMVAVQFGWPFAGLIVCAVVSGRRKRRLYRSAEMTLHRSTWCSGGPGTDGHYDLILQSPGYRKIHVIMEIRRVTNMGMKEAKDLVDNAPGPVLQQVSVDRADRAKALLERLGATAIVSGDPGWD
jgi:ribosomal protein L7/L12